MKRLLTTVVILLAFVGPVFAGTLDLEWSPAVGATGYDVEESLDNGITWRVMPVTPVCSGTPIACKATVTFSATARPLYRFVAKNAVGRVPSSIYIGSACDTCILPDAVDRASAGRP